MPAKRFYRVSSGFAAETFNDDASSPEWPAPHFSRAVWGAKRPVSIRVLARNKTRNDTHTHTHTHTATSSSGLFAAFHRLCGENQRPSEPSSWRPKEHRLASANQLGVSLNRPLQLGRQRRRVSRRRSLRLLGIRFVCLGNFARITTPAVVRPSTCRLQSAIKSYFIKHGSRLRAVSFFFLLPRQIRVAQPNKTTTTATFTTSPHTHTHTHQTPLKKRPNKQQEPVVMPLKISIFPR